MTFSGSSEHGGTKLRHRHMIGFGMFAGGMLGAALLSVAAAPAAQAVPFEPEPPCIMTGAGQCVPDTVWPIHAGGGNLHPVPPISNPEPPIHHPVPPIHHPEPPIGVHPIPPVNDNPVPPPGVITCIVGEGCFGHPIPVTQPGDPDAAATASSEAASAAALGSHASAPIDAVGSNDAFADLAHDAPFVGPGIADLFGF